MRNIIVDAGALVATFSPTDAYRTQIEAKFAAFVTEGLRLISTWPCVVEASHLLAAQRRFELLHWIELGGLVVYPFEATHLTDMLVWMRRYTEAGKREMDFADATLYWLAADTGVTAILTTDRTDFERYRLPDGRSFEIV